MGVLALDRFVPPSSDASNAAAADPGSYAVELIETVDLPRLADAWQALADRAIEPNAFLAPAFATAALTRLADARDNRVLAVWRADSQGTTLVGLTAFSVSSRRWGLPLRAIVAMAHNYGFLGTPLLDREHAVDAAEAMLRFLADRRHRSKVMLLPFLTSAGPVAGALRAAAARLDLRHQAVLSFERGLAMPGEANEPGRYVEAALGRKRRHELARQTRRLAELGTTTREVLTEPDQVAAGLEAFLALEASGWKGNAGTATIQRADRAAFFRQAAIGMAKTGQTRLHLLRLDGRPIAAGIAFLAGDRGWFLKIAYDESLARFSPGVQLAAALTDDVLAQPGIRSIDSVAISGHPMIDHMWRERLPVADWMIDLVPGGSITFRLAVRLETARNRARDLARAGLYRLRRLRRS